MKNKRNLQWLAVAAFFGLMCTANVIQAQTNTPQTQAQDQPATQVPQAPNLQTELNMTPDQIQKWRTLNMELRPQEVAGALKVREARRALADAMEAPTPNEELIKQQAKELADAQSAMTQLQALRQARVLQILTPEQRVRLKEIRERNMALRRQQKAGEGLGQDRQLKRGANAPAMSPAQRRALRQQQKQKP